MTITYIEKGPGVMAAISAAGHTLYLQDNAWVASDEAAVQDIIDGYTLDQAKECLVARIHAKAKAVFDRAIAGVSAGEMAGWPILRAEANAYAADNTVAVPAITAEAAQRGVTVPELVAKVQANAAHFDALRAGIAGTSGKHRDEVSLLVTFEELAAYDYGTDWPGA